MKLKIVSPVKAYIESASEDEMMSLRKQLTYTNSSVNFQLMKLNKQRWFKENHPEKWHDRYDELKGELKKTLIYQDEGGTYIRPGSISYLEGFSIQTENLIQYPTPKPFPWAKKPPFEPYVYQNQSVENMIAEKHGAVSLCTGCHGKGTEILMFDGSVRPVEDIKIGDLLMGPDSKPRMVLKLHRGKDEMVRINPIKGDSFVVNAGHILSLKIIDRKTKKDIVKNISVRDFLNLPKNAFSTHKLYREGVSFKEKMVDIPPYILGLWLGDGTSKRCTLTTEDGEIQKEWENYLLGLGLIVNKTILPNNRASQYNGIDPEWKPLGRKPTAHPFHVILKKYGLFDNKHIPIEYLINSEKNRLELLAGLIDTDGYLSTGFFEIIQKNKKLSEDIIFLARSLGFLVTSKEKKNKDQNGKAGIYTRINISGDVDRIPVRLERKKAEKRKQKKNWKKTGIRSIDLLSKDDFYGFELDGDHLYLTKDFTVTHNSGKSLILQLLTKNLGQKTAIIVPTKGIFLEVLESFEEAFGKNKVGAFGNGRKDLKKDITVCIGKSVSMIEPGSDEDKFFKQKKVLIFDECHLAAATELEKICHRVLAETPYRFFLSGTQTRGDGAIRLLQSITGRIVHELSTKDGISGGFLSPLEYRIVSVDSGKVGFNSPDAARMKREHLLYNKNVIKKAAQIANAVVKQRDENVLILVEEIEQLSMLIKELTVPFVYTHGNTTNKEELARLGLQKTDLKEVLEKFHKKIDGTMVLIGTENISIGVNTFAHHGINLQGGASEIGTRQGIIGRMVRITHRSKYKEFHKEKKMGYIYDFRIRPDVTKDGREFNYELMEKHLIKRIGYYSDTGGKIIEIP